MCKGPELRPKPVAKIKTNDSTIVLTVYTWYYCTYNTTGWPLFQRLTSYSFLGIFNRSAPYSWYDGTFETSVTAWNIRAATSEESPPCKPQISHKSSFFLPVSPREFNDRSFSDSYVFINHDNIPVPCDALIIIFAAGRASLRGIVIEIQETCRLLGDSLQTRWRLPIYQRNFHLH